MNLNSILRIQRIHSVALLLILTYAVWIAHVLAFKTFVNLYVDTFVAFITSVSFYLFIVRILCTIVERFPLLMKIYWGKQYIDGLWSYWYVIDGDESKKIHFGIWKIEQDLYRTSVMGFGLSDNYEIRSNVRSVTDFIDIDNCLEVINKRCDAQDSSKEVFSRTTMFFELKHDGILKSPYRMKGKTYVYGGPRNEIVCNNSFLRHNKAMTVQEVIEIIRNNINSYGTIFGVSEYSGEPNETCGIIKPAVTMVSLIESNASVIK